MARINWFRSFLLGLLLLFVNNCYAEDMTATIDGSKKKVSLHENGTWDALPEPVIKLVDQPKDLAAAVTVFDSTMLHRTVEYSPSVTLAIRYENHTSKRVTGLVVSLVVKNGFGNTLYATTLQEDISIGPGEKTEGSTYWHWDDNKFINGEPYDKMWQAADNNTAKVDVKILKAVFDDGLILKTAAPSQKKKSK